MDSVKFDSHSKILVVGTSGSGKSTLARSLAQKLQIHDIELDALFWKENWTQSDQIEFREKISNALSKNSGWVIHGNYNKVKDLTWGNAKTIIWLDYPKSIVMWRVIKRSLLRILKNETLWAGNKESFKKTFFSKDSIILWAWQTYELRRKQYTELIQDPQYKHIQVIHFRNPGDAEGFLNLLDKSICKQVI
jgi:adenylate kinase family enzyme